MNAELTAHQAEETGRGGRVERILKCKHRFCNKTELLCIQITFSLIIVNGAHMQEINAVGKNLIK